MKNLRPTSVLFAVALLLTSFLTGCEKEDSAPESESLEGLFYYYADEENLKIRVIDLNAVSPFRRSYTLTDEVTLEVIAKDREELVIKAYRPATTSQMVSMKGMLIKSKNAVGQWLYVGNNPWVGLTGIADETWFDASEFAEGATGFRLHKKEVINGEVVYAIESTKYPGWYFSHNGHPIQGANLLCLEEFADIEKAPGYRIYEPGVQVLEGDPNVPRESEIGGK
ncbi:MAG: hypothetical protein AB9888_05430 [Bacteroidales bacterium]